MYNRNGRNDRDNDSGKNNVKSNTSLIASVKVRVESTIVLETTLT